MYHAQRHGSPIQNYLKTFYLANKRWTMRKKWQRYSDLGGKTIKFYPGTGSGEVWNITGRGYWLAVVPQCYSNFNIFMWKSNWMTMMLWDLLGLELSRLSFLRRMLRPRLRPQLRLRIWLYKKSSELVINFLVVFRVSKCSNRFWLVPVLKRSLLTQCLPSACEI